MENLKRYIHNLVSFSDESWNVLADCFTEKRLNKGDLLLKEGAICRSVYFISRGYCKARYNKNGREINMAFYFENDFATNVASLLNGTHSDYDLVAGEKLDMVQFDKDALLGAYARSQEIETFGRKVLEIILSTEQEHANDFKLLSPSERFEKLQRKHPEFLQRISLTQTASYLGMSRETLSRLRKKKIL